MTCKNTKKKGRKGVKNMFDIDDNVYVINELLSDFPSFRESLLKFVTN